MLSRIGWYTGDGDNGKLKKFLLDFFIFSFVLIDCFVLLKDGVESDKRRDQQRADCAQRGGVWLTRENACVAGPK